jgi:hypothetical protein
VVLDFRHDLSGRRPTVRLVVETLVADERLGAGRPATETRTRQYATGASRSAAEVRRSVPCRAPNSRLARRRNRSTAAISSPPDEETVNDMQAAAQMDLGEEYA